MLAPILTSALMAIASIFFAPVSGEALASKAAMAADTAMSSASEPSSNDSAGFAAPGFDPAALDAPLNNPASFKAPSNGLAPARTLTIAGGPLLSFIYDGSPHRYMIGQGGQIILVLQGRIRNDFNHPVSRVRLRGTLKDSKGEVLNERRAPAGNLVSESDLKTLPMTEILAKLSPIDGAGGANLGIAPGAEVPFMLVFDNIPPNLFEYVIDPVGWEPAE